MTGIILGLSIGAGVAYIIAALVQTSQNGRGRF